MLGAASKPQKQGARLEKGRCKASAIDEVHLTMVTVKVAALFPRAKDG